MQAYVERGYGLFLRRVGDGRKMQVADVDSIAQGRVWTGQQALELKLVDAVGSLQDAVAYAAKLAKITDYGVDKYPAPLTFWEQMQNTYSGEDYLEGRLRTALGMYYGTLRFATQVGDRPSLQARMLYDPNIR